MRLIAAVLVLMAAVSVRAAEPTGVETEEQKTLYTLGSAVGKSLQVFNLKPAELKTVMLGISDTVKGVKPTFDTEAYTQKIQELVKDRQGAAAEAEKKNAKAYLEKAAKEEGAQSSPSGLIYIEKKPGDGASPKSTDKVKVHYTGTLTDGTEFDSSVKRGMPATFPLNGVIPCWTEGIQKMKVNGKARLVCPSGIAYGDQGRPPRIPGGATLVFDVELLGIESAVQPPLPNPAKSE